MNIESRLNRLEQCVEPEQRLHAILGEVRKRDPSVFLPDGGMDFTRLTDDELIRLEVATRNIKELTG